MKKLMTFLALLLVSSLTHASPPYGIFQQQDDGSGSNNWGFYFVPPSPTGAYLWVYDGANWPSNPMKMATFGQGLNWDLATTTLSVVLPLRTFVHTTRSLNTCFRPSATIDASVSYAVDISTSLTISGGAQGTVYLRTYTDSSCTANTQEVTRFTSSNTGTLTVGLALTQVITAKLGGIVPAGRYVQLVTENNTGTPTFTARPGQEVLL